VSANIAPLSWSLAILVALLVLGWAWLAGRLMRNSRASADVGIALLLIRLYARVVHRLRISGRDHVPRTVAPGPLILVVNHTAGVDPILLQAACPFEIRWMMAEDMRLPRLEALWDWARVIFVNRDRADFTGTREALRHLREGGVLGMFPEGGLERPARMLLPFQTGVGVMARRTGARVLPVVIEGTPQVDPAWSSLWHCSRSRLTFHAPIDYAATGMSPDEITADLRRRFMDWTGWPGNDAPAPGIVPSAPRRRATA
jgi:1-acyl-sn-glycerol-3-phosphate acyltransferase